ncbi:hypothetical protein MKW92_007186 [Papaver armeniacum]|nr:hypothetical protein MKW92_007186 [Papaver armeniacum]
MGNSNVQIRVLILITFASLFFIVKSQTNPGDAAVMLDLRKSLRFSNELVWSSADPCNWEHISCNEFRVTHIKLKRLNISGVLPETLKNLKGLRIISIQGNKIAGALPTFSGMSSLQVVSISKNMFSSFPEDFFEGLISLSIFESNEIPFKPWNIPRSLTSARRLRFFSANAANLIGNVPQFLEGFNFPHLQSFHVSFNSLEGGLPDSLGTTILQSIRLNDQSGLKLNGSISILGNITSLSEVFLHGNQFSGTLPDFSQNLQKLNVSDNLISGLIPASLISLKSLRMLSLSSNLLQGPIPVFESFVKEVDLKDNSFCLSLPGYCDPLVNILLSFARALGYPRIFAERWRGNEPCAQGKRFLGIECSGNETITGINILNFGLIGTLSPDISSIQTLQRIIVAGNEIHGTIPEELTGLQSLKEIDVSYTNISGPLPQFRNEITVKTVGSNISRHIPSPPGSSSDKKLIVILCSVIGGGVVLVVLLGILLFCIYRRKRKGGSVHNPNCPSNNVLEVGAVVFTITQLRTATENFYHANIIGKGGFSTVYKGRLQDGTIVAVKRIFREGINGKGLQELKREVESLSKLRHMNLVSLLGYCSEDDERILVLEFVSNGTLSQHLLNRNRFPVLDWKRRMLIALDVASGIHYLHNFCQPNLIHRDLKSTNILLDGDMKAKLADFGLVHKAPEGNFAVTDAVGTMGHIAPEYESHGKLTKKVDIYSFGVVLAQIITGRKVVDLVEGELLKWLKAKVVDQAPTEDIIDPAMQVTEEVIKSVDTVLNLVCMCCLIDPDQRPDIDFVVRTVTDVVKNWEAVPNYADVNGIEMMRQEHETQPLYQGRNSSEVALSNVSEIMTGR